jgi:hypothetical protein
VMSFFNGSTAAVTTVSTAIAACHPGGGFHALHPFSSGAAGFVDEGIGHAGVTGLKDFDGFLESGDIIARAPELCVVNHEQSIACAPHFIGSTGNDGSSGIGVAIDDANDARRLTSQDGADRDRGGEVAAFRSEIDGDEGDIAKSEQSVFEFFERAHAAGIHSFPGPVFGGFTGFANVTAEAELCAGGEGFDSEPFFFVRRRTRRGGDL